LPTKSNRTVVFLAAPVLMDGSKKTMGVDDSETASAGSSLTECGAEGWGPAGQAHSGDQFHGSSQKTSAVLGVAHGQDWQRGNSVTFFNSSRAPSACPH
jgi:hypothetical protein